MMKGKHDNCPMYDCPHKVELAKAIDDINALESTNQELNNRMSSVDKLIEEGLTDFKGIMNEVMKDKFKVEDIDKILGKIERAFDSKKITEIVDENLKLRKILQSERMQISGLKSDNLILRQNNEALEVGIKSREEQDLKMIKDLRNMQVTSENNLRTLSEQSSLMSRNELQLKALDEFIASSRLQIGKLKEEHENYLKQAEIMKKENALLSKNNVKIKALLPKKARQVLSLSDEVKRLKEGRINMIDLLMKKNAITGFKTLKAMFFSLNDVERSYCIEKYDETARLMGE